MAAPQQMLLAGGGLTPPAFVAITTGFGSSAYYSYDGLTWTAGSGLPANAANTYVNVLSGPNGLKVAVQGNSGAATNKAAYSYDSIHWNAATLSSSQVWGNQGAGRTDSSLAFGNGGFLLTTTGNTNVTTWSADGVTWNAGSSSGLVAAASAVWNGSVFLLANYNTTAGVTASAANGSWSAVTLPLATSAGFMFATNTTFMMFAASATQTMYTSTDGSSWTTQTNALPSSQSWGYSGAFDGVYAVVGDASGHLAYSSNNGVSWTAWAAPVAAQGKIIVAQGTWFFFPGTSTTYYTASAVGGGWTSHVTPANVVTVAYG